MGANDRRGGRLKVAGFIFAFAAGLCGVAVAEESAGAPPHWLYAKENFYEVSTGGKKVGEHLLRFDDGGGGRLTVAARTRASVSFYGVFDMPFQYDSAALWQGGELINITASYLRGFIRGAASATKKGNRYQTAKGEGAPAPLFPTNHWHRGVLMRDYVFNTLGGGVAAINITPDARLTTINAGGKMRRARRYVYDGDLQLESWYDESGRWLKMRFGALGGVYEFTCRLCEPQ